MIKSVTDTPMSPFSQIAIALIAATAFGFIVRLLRQPLILAYLVAGIVLGPAVAKILDNASVITSLSTLGIALLLFLIGLDLDLRKLRALSTHALIIGLGQILVTVIIGFAIMLAFKASLLSAFYIATALTFSSTIIVVKLLSEKRDLDAWYARLTVGVLLVQDLIAILILIFLSALSHNTLTPLGLAQDVVWFFLKAGILIAAILLSTQTVLDPLLRNTARTPELLFLTSITWCLLGALLAEWVGLSVAIGAFAAGLSLAQLPYRLEISGRIRPLRDFFVTLFFIALGAQFVITPDLSLMSRGALLSLFVLLGNPLIVMIIMGILGYRKRIGLFVGLAVAQVSEFSLLLMAMGATLGHVSQTDVALVTMVAIITIPASSYFILYSERIYRTLAPFLRTFERAGAIDPQYTPKVRDGAEVILFGYHRMGTIIAQSLDRMRTKTIIVDFNPDIIHALIAAKRWCVYGDISDHELMHDLPFEHAHSVISTIPDFDDNARLLEVLRQRRFSGTVTVTALTTDDALTLYARGADYVIFPHALSAMHYTALLKDGSLAPRTLGLERTRHIKTLEGMKKKELPY